MSIIEEYNRNFSKYLIDKDYPTALIWSRRVIEEICKNVLAENGYQIKPKDNISSFLTKITNEGWINKLILFEMRTIQNAGNIASHGTSEDYNLIDEDFIQRVKVSLDKVLNWYDPKILIHSDEFIKEYKTGRRKTKKIVIVIGESIETDYSQRNAYDLKFAIEEKYDLEVEIINDTEYDGSEFDSLPTISLGSAEQNSITNRIILNDNSIRSEDIENEIRNTAFFKDDKPMFALWGNSYENQNAVVKKFIIMNGLDQFIDDLD